MNELMLMGKYVAVAIVVGVVIEKLLYYWAYGGKRSDDINRKG